MSETATIDLPDALRHWIESETGASVRAARPNAAGASRSAWQLDLDAQGAGPPAALFLLQDRGRGGGSQRDAAVLAALAATDVPVPRVIAASQSQRALLLSRLPGTSEYPEGVAPAEREAIAAHLMEIAGRLHALDPHSLQIEHLEVPETAQACARSLLDPALGAVEALGSKADPCFGFALAWLAAHLPSDLDRPSLVHGDLGPGNFLHEAGRVTGLVDWEVAHFGDPMEDLAALAVRDMATPVGSLAKRFAEYEACSGRQVDLQRVQYYRALVLLRNSAMIGLGLAHPTEALDVQEMTMYQTLLLRGAALVMCDILGVARPEPPEDDRALQEAAPPGTDSGTLAAHHARRMLALAWQRRSLLGPLAERWPQPLEST